MHLGLVMPNSPSFWAHVLAAWRLGGTAVPYNVREPANVITSALKHVQASLVILSKGRADMTSNLELAGIPWAIAPYDAPYKASLEVLDVYPGKEDTAVIFILGTGGKPKAVPCHGSLYANALTCIEQVEPIEEGDILLNAARLPRARVFHFGCCHCC